MNPSHRIEISTLDQCLHLFQEETRLRVFPISTARNGLGCEEGSHCTPTGRFRIFRKIGADAAWGTIFQSRTPTGLWTPAQQTSEDLILSRILWLEGLQAANANTRDRYIYIHGTNHESLIGTPVSHGCVRMRNQDVIDLFDQVDEGTPVRIQ